MTADRLRALDATFLDVERDGAHMHVGAVLRLVGEPVSHEELAATIARRLHLVPRYRQRLAPVPFGASYPVWVDDTSFDLARHVRRVALPAPAARSELRELAGWILAQPLDRRRPLWELWLCEGFQEGGSVLISKMHHCLVDGLASLNIATVLFDGSSSMAAIEASDPWSPRSSPSATEVLSGAARDRVAHALRLTGAAVGALRAPATSASHARRALTGLATFVAESLSPAPSSPYNRATGAGRRVAWCGVDIDVIRLIRRSFGGSANDVVLAAVAGALRRHLLRRGEAVGGGQLKVMVPVSVRTAAERRELGNRMTMLWARLPVGEADATRRLAAVSAVMRRLKDSDQVAGCRALSAALEMAPPFATARVARLLASPRTFNLTVTNVPGPRDPLHLGERRLEEMIPIVPIAGGHGLGIAVLRYQRRLCFGLLGDDMVMHDLDDLAADIEGEFGALAAAARQPDGRVLGAGATVVGRVGDERRARARTRAATSGPRRTSCGPGQAPVRARARTMTGTETPAPPRDPVA